MSPKATFGRWCDTRGFVHKTLAYGQLWSLVTMKSLAHPIRCLKKLAWLVEVDAKASASVETFDSPDPSGIFKHIRSLLPRAKTDMYDLANQEGLIASDVCQHKSNFRSHLCNIMDGSVFSFKDVVDHHRSNQSDNVSLCQGGTLPTSVEVDPNMFATFPDLQVGFAKAKSNVVGENCLGGDLSCLDPFAFASLYYPVVVKYISGCFLPTQWVGGQALELYKHKGSPFLPDSYRDINIADAPSKPLIKNLRRKFATPSVTAFH